MESPVHQGENPRPTTPSPWHSYITSRLQSSAADSSLDSTHSVHRLQWLQDLMPEAEAKFKHYEGAFFGKVKDELMSARDYPGTVVGVAFAASFLLLRGPRKFLLRHTLGRFQSEEARFIRAEKNVKELNLSVDLFKKDGNKLLERADLAEKEMRDGHAELVNAGNHIRRMAKSMYQLEGRTRDLLEGLRQVPGREAIQLRAEVASLTSRIKDQRTSLDRRMTKLAELGIRV